MYRDREAPAPPLDRSTLAVTAGRPRGPNAPLNHPPVFASAFSAGDGIGYARRSNPTWESLEEALGALEGGAAVAFGSGMAAATAVADLFAVGARIAVADDAYIEVRRLLGERQARGLIELETVDSRDCAAVIGAVGRADAVWLDAIANPRLDVPELDVIGRAAQRLGTMMIVDSTLATPVLLRPIELGAALVVHSATKYIGGHSDLVLGAVVAHDPRLASRLFEHRAVNGSVPGTMEAWLALRGIRTLPLRIERGARSAALLAGRLEGHRGVGRVRYPGLPSDPSHAIATRLLDAPGAIVAFELADADRADRLCEELRLITHASSLGGVETLIDRQSRWHAEASVADGLLRLSVGCEDPEDLWRDLDQALAA